MKADDVIFTFYHFYSSTVYDYLMHEATDAPALILSKPYISPGVHLQSFTKMSK